MTSSCVRVHRERLEQKKPTLHTAQSEHWHVSSIASHSEFNQWQSPTTFAQTKTLSCPRGFKTQTNTDMSRPSQNRGQIKTKTEQSVKVWTERTPLTWTVDQTHHSGPCERRHWSLKGWEKLSNSCILLVAFEDVVHDNNDTRASLPGVWKTPPGHYVQNQGKTEAKDCQGRGETEHVSRTRPVSRTAQTQSLTFGGNVLVPVFPRINQKMMPKISTHESSLS